MELVLVLGALGIGALWVAYNARKAFAAQPLRRRLSPAPAPRRTPVVPPRRTHLRVANTQARNLQLALLRLDGAPDFRRAASFARAARLVPVAFRQRQFQRFRTKLVSHFAAGLVAGTDGEQLATSLADLLEALGVAAFEGDYLRGEAERRVAVTRRPAAPPTFGQRLAALQREHEERMAAIHDLPNLDDETREPLCEAEVMRYREVLQHLGTLAPSRPTP
jgi:hypothetical protein